MHSDDKQHGDREFKETAWQIARFCIIALTLSLLITAAGITWINYGVPGAWPPWLGPEN